MKLVFRCFYALSLTATLIATAPAEPVQVTPPEMSGAQQPQLATSPDGVIHVTFGNGTAIFYTMSANAGQTFAPPKKIAELPKLALGRRRGPRIAATDRAVVITAISHADGTLQAWTSEDRGANWKLAGPVNDAAKSAEEGLHAIAANGDLVFAAWLDDRNKGKEIWGAKSIDGGRTWSANKLIYHSPDGPVCPCCHPSVAIDSSGKVAVMWRNALNGARDMYLTTSSDGGATFSAPQKLGTESWHFNACPMDGGSLVFAGGKPEAVYRRDRTIFAADGPNETKLAADAAQPVVVPTKKGLFYIWESGNRLMMQGAGSTPKTLAQQGSFATATALPGGGAIVAWEAGQPGKRTIQAEVIGK